MFRQTFKIICLVIFGIIGSYTLLANGKGSGNPPPITDDVYLGIYTLEHIDDWCNISTTTPTCPWMCKEQPDDPNYQTPSGGARRDLQKLRFDPYVGISQNYWMQYGGDGQELCSDNEVNWSNFHNCLVIEDVNISVPQTVWIQLMTECDRCVNNTTGGSWWKWEQMYGADELPTLCNDFMTLALMNERVYCPSVFDNWGCGPGEMN